MQARDFCFWLKGYLEITQSAQAIDCLTSEQVEMIEKHLDLVFIHEIDPSMGGPEHQKKLNQVHADGVQSVYKPAMRC